MRDESTDKKSGKKTLAVRFGPNFVRGEYIFTLVMSLLMPVFLAFYINSHWFICFTLMIFIPGYFAIRSILYESGAELNKTLNRTGKIILLYGIIFSIGWWIG